MRARALAQFGGIERTAFLIRVEYDDAFLERQAHEEVSRKRNALQRHAQALRELDLHDGERYRIAEAAIQYVVQVAVARVVVVLVVAAETEFVEQKTVDAAQLRRFGISAAQQLAQAKGIGQQAGLLGGGVEFGILVLGDEQCGGEQGDVGVVGVAQNGPRILHHRPPAAAWPRWADITRSADLRKTRCMPAKRPVAVIRIAQEAAGMNVPETVSQPQ
jgi:hypothetical protein